MGSLLTKLKEEKEFVKKAIELKARYRTVPKIIADGGFKRIDQCVKALALGADFVMLGEIIAKSDEACGEIVVERNKYGFKSREYFGMSTEKAQAIVNDASLFKVDNFVPKHSEGQIKTVDVEYTLSEWLGDFDHALRSSMSYTGARRLEEFIGKVNWDNMSPVTFKAYMK
jgi:IMP dehydrogenase